MNETKKRYKNKCKNRQVTFYLNDTEMMLYKFSKRINFQAFVKDALQNALEDYLIQGGKL